MSYAKYKGNQDGFVALSAIIFISALLVAFGFMLEIANYMYSLIKIEQWTDIATHSVVNAYNQTMKSYADELKTSFCEDEQLQTQLAILHPSYVDSCESYSDLSYVIPLKTYRDYCNLLSNPSDYPFCVKYFNKPSDYDSLLNTIKSKANQSADEAFNLIMLEVKKDLKDRVNVYDQIPFRGYAIDPKDNKLKDSFTVTLKAKYLAISKLISLPKVEIVRTSERYSQWIIETDQLESF